MHLAGEFRLYKTKQLSLKGLKILCDGFGRD